MICFGGTAVDASVGSAGEGDLDVWDLTLEVVAGIAGGCCAAKTNRPPSPGINEISVARIARICGGGLLRNNAKRSSR